MEYVPPWKTHELVELRDQVKALPVGARRVLKGGPRKEPGCVVCAALEAVDGCASYATEVRDYHEVSIFDVATWIGMDLETVAEWATDEDEDGSGSGLIYLAMRGALQAERCSVICLLAGWVPPRMRLPRGWREMHA
jgi:hypothetical protein